MSRALEGASDPDSTQPRRLGRVLRALRLEQFEVIEKVRVARGPAELLAGDSRGRRLISREARPERTKVLLGHLLDRQAESLADDRDDVADSVAFVVDRVPARPRGG